MTPQYFSQRQGECLPLRQSFWTAFSTLAKSFVPRQYFPAYTKFSPTTGWNDNPLRNALAIDLGRRDWSPLAYLTTRPNNDAEVLDYVEALFKFCDARHKQQYQAEVNETFVRFNQPFVLRGNRVEHLRSPTLDAMVQSFDFPTHDPELHRLVASATADFFDSRHDRRREALQKIAQALERLKTEALGSREKKSESAELLVDELVGPQRPLRDEFSQLLKTMGRIANEGMRHAEHGSESIQDSILLEFTFYHYFNVLRALALRRAPKNGATSGRA